MINEELPGPKATKVNAQISTNLEIRVMTNPIGGEEFSMRFEGHDVRN